MSTSRFQLCLTTGLAVFSGMVISFALTSNNAIGLPSTSTISSGVNPIVAHGGQLPYNGGNVTVLTAPSDYDVIITDVVLTGAMTSYDCRGQTRVLLSTDSNSSLASFSIDQRASYDSSSGLLATHYQSGLPVRAGESLIIQSFGNYQSCGGSAHRVDYSISGYKAQP